MPNCAALPDSVGGRSPQGLATKFATKRQRTADCVRNFGSFGPLGGPFVNRKAVVGFIASVLFLAPGQLSPAQRSDPHPQLLSVAGTAEVAANAPVLQYVPGSTIKLQQLLGEEDKERHQPTLSRTLTRYGIEGTDLGYSFEHEGRVYFLFGDTVGRLRHAFDTIATTDALDPESGVRLDFLT